MSDLKEKIKSSLDGNLYISGEGCFSCVEGKGEAIIEISTLFNTHASERAVAFAEYCDKNGWYRVADNIWVSDEYPEMSKGKISSKELYQLFDNETKLKQK